jgi:translation initiation factor IF-3
MTNHQFTRVSDIRGKDSFQRKFGNPGTNFIRKNEKIRAKEVRIIDGKGQQLGIMQVLEAISIAKKQGLHLVEISGNAHPPICKVLDFGKVKYSESKDPKNTSKHASSKTKEGKLHVAIDINNYDTKMRHGIEFLEHGNKLKLTLMFREREMAYTKYWIPTNCWN